MVVGPFHGVHAAVVPVEDRAEGVFERVVGVAASAPLRAVVPAVLLGLHGNGGGDVAFALLVGDVEGHLVAVGVVGLFDYVDFAFLGPVQGAAGHPEGGPGATGAAGC